MYLHIPFAYFTYAFPEWKRGKSPGAGGHGLGKKVLKIRPNEMGWDHNRGKQGGE
jgi:hypothetical protein